MQIETKMSYHLIAGGMAIIKKTRYKYWRGCGEKGTLVHCWWECRLVQPLWKTAWSFLKMLKMELPYDPVFLLLEIYPKKPQNTNLKEYMHPYVHCSVIYNSQDLEAAQVPISR